MENRFGLKDLIVILLLLGILVTMWLKMVMDDRQWDRLVQIEEKLDQTTSDIAGLRRQIDEGVVLTQAGSPSDTPRDNIFERVRRVKALEDYAQGGEIIESFSSAPPKLNPLTAHDVYSRVIYTKVLEPLATFDLGKVRMVPHVASGWEMAEDGLSMDVALRTNVVFSDGEPMDADDVVYTWQMMQDEEITDVHTREYVRHITKVEKLEPYKVRFHFEKVFYENELRALEQPVLPKHFFEKFSKRKIREDPALLMGSGPYRLTDPEKYVPGQQIDLVRNERYWGEPGPYDRIVYRIIEKESTELVAFTNGELDMYVPTPEQHVEMRDHPRFAELRDRTQQYVYEHIRTGYSYMAWNQEKGGKPTVFADKRVRQAMTMLVDREGIRKEIYLGFASIANGPFSHLSKQYNPDVDTWPYDPERAIKQLESLGFRRDASGTMLKPDGTPFEFELTYPGGSDFIQKLALYLKDNFARAGIAMNLNPQKWVLFIQSLTQKDFEVITLAWGAGGIESDIEQMFHSRTIDGGDNRQAYRSDELDSLIDKAHVTLDVDERMKIWQKCHEILHEDQPYTFMFRSQVRLWADGRVANIKLIPVWGVNYTSTLPIPIEWYIPKDKQRRGK